MRYCTNCGSAVPENAQHCPRCGNSLSRRKLSPIPFFLVGFILLMASGILLGNYLKGQPLLFSQSTAIPSGETAEASTQKLPSTGNNPTQRVLTITATSTAVPTPTQTLIPTATPVFSWSKSVVESSSNKPGPFLSMEVGSDGTYYLAYYLDRKDQLKVIEGNGKSWKALRNLVQLNTEGRVGFYIDLDLSSGDVPYLSYLIYDKNIGRGVYQTSDSTWSSAVIGRDLNIFDMRVSLDTTGTPHYAVLSQNGDILYRTSRSDLTKIENGALPPSSIEVGFRYFPIALAVDSSQNPYICFSKSGILQCIYNTGNSWQTMRVAENGVYPSLQIDSLGNLHLAYYDYKERVLKYAFFSSRLSTWAIDTVDSTDGAGWYPSLRVDPNNWVHISYYDSINTSLKYARGRIGGWSRYTVDSDGDVGLISSLVIDLHNNPAIAYYDSNRRQINFAVGYQK